MILAATVIGVSIYLVYQRRAAKSGKLRTPDLPTHHSSTTHPDVYGMAAQLISADLQKTLGARPTLHFMEARSALSECSYVRPLCLHHAGQLKNYPQEMAVRPMRKPPAEFGRGDTVMFRDNDAVIRVGDVQEYPVGKPRPSQRLCMWLKEQRHYDAC